MSPAIPDYVLDKANAVMSELNNAKFDANAFADEIDGFLYMCKDPNFVGGLVDIPGLIEKLLWVMENFCPHVAGINASIAVINLAIFPLSHKKLLSNRALEIALHNLKFLKDTAPNDELDCGLSAAFLIIRTVGNQESGPGPAAIKGNPVLVKKLYWVLESVLTTGECLGFRWDPANIVMDVATLAASDKNKPLLADFVPLLSLALKNPYNFRTIKYTSKALSQLVFEPKCKDAMLAKAEEITTRYENIDMDEYQDNNVSDNVSVYKIP